MLLTITNTQPPASDLGYLLHKNPTRAQSFALSFGSAHVFYPEASEERCTVALLLDIDAVGLVRNRQGPAGEGGMLAQYVNDRPYVASSFMSVAIAQIFRSAMAGHSQSHAELAETALPLTARLSALPCRGDLNGTDQTHYSPALTSTRAQFAKVVVLAFGLPTYTPSSGQDFTDVPPGYFAYSYIESGFHAGILGGYDANTCAAHNAQFPCYLPNLPITRGQVTKLVVNAAHYPLFTPTGGQQTFTDVPPSNVFFAAIETAHNKGVINGYPDNTFRPNDNVRRDAMAQIVYKGVTTP